MSAKITKGGSSSVMRTIDFVIASIIMCIPVVGLVVYIIWACGGCENLNRRNFARAMLILLAVGLVLSLLSYFAVNKVIGAALGGGGFQGLFGILKQFGGR
ncbi:hypothetical protein R84B8_00015 [Treponema sp. R8-4-B8]